MEKKNKISIKFWAYPSFPEVVQSQFVSDHLMYSIVNFFWVHLYVAF